MRASDCEDVERLCAEAEVERLQLLCRGREVERERVRECWGRGGLENSLLLSRMEVRVLYMLDAAME